MQFVAGLVSVMPTVPSGPAVAVIVAVVVVLGSRGSGKTPPPVAAPVAVKVLVPEGETRAQIALIAAHDGLRGAPSRAHGTSPARSGRGP